MCCAGLQHDFSAALGTYPPAQASHQAVVADRQLFMRTLRQLHDQLGTQFRIPMVSGRELDIHLLYKQVLQADTQWTSLHHTCMEMLTVQQDIVPDIPLLLLA